MSLRVTISHAFPAFTLDLAFEAPTPGVVGLFGPSGSGKSTVLAAIAGLLPSSDAQVTLDGADLHALPAERRRIGTVFQDGRLFPHLTVEANLRYGLRRAPSGPIGFATVAHLLGLENLLLRRPATLSGGERQRVAIGRALLSQPHLLLMDEPLAALDTARRDEILPYLSRLRTAFAIPIVYASHALDEMARLADTLVLIEGGRVRAAGPIGEIMASAELPLAARPDAAGLLSGHIAAQQPERGLSVVACGGQVLLVPLVAAAIGEGVRLRVPAREVMLALDPPGRTSVNNVLQATVAAIGEDQTGHAALVELDVAGGRLLARVTQDAAARLALKPGVTVLALIKAMSVDLMA